MHISFRHPLPHGLPSCEPGFLVICRRSRLHSEPQEPSVTEDSKYQTKRDPKLEFLQPRNFTFLGVHPELRIVSRQAHFKETQMDKSEAIASGSECATFFLFSVAIRPL